MEKLQYDRYYHIYNRGINGTNLFLEADNYSYFLELYSIYIEPIAETFAWCLMPNHFHFLIRVKAENEIGFLNPQFAKDDDKSKKWKAYFPVTPAETALMLNWKKPQPSRQFAHLFDAYTLTINGTYKRTGGLFEEPFRRKPIANEKYLKTLIVYIHNNPVKHGFVPHALDYPWSSYLSIISVKPTCASHNKVIGWFDSAANFKSLHQQPSDDTDISEFIIDL